MLKWLKTLFSIIFIQKEIVIDKSCRIIPGGGSNSLLLQSKDGKKALLVDSKMWPSSISLQKIIKAENIFLVNTHFHPDHLGGNKLFKGATLISGSQSITNWDGRRILIKPGKTRILKIDDERIHIIDFGRGHSKEDIAVYLEKRKILSTGDITFNKVHAVMFKTDGNIDSWMKTLHKLKKLYKKAVIIPGHGAVSDQRLIKEVIEYFDSAKRASFNPSITDAVRKKYRNYFGIPGITSMKRTIGYFKN